MKFARGVTFVEIITVIGIIGIMTGVVFVFVDDSKTEEVLDAEARQFATTLREMQDHALNGKRISNPSDAASCGFGMHYMAGASEWSTYVVLRQSGWDDCVSNITTLADDTSGNTPEITAWTMPDSVSLTVNSAIQDVAFDMPFAHVFLYDDSGNQVGGKVQFMFSAAGDTRYVCLESSGLVNETGSNPC